MTLLPNQIILFLIVAFSSIVTALPPPQSSWIPQDGEVASAFWSTLNRMAHSGESRIDHSYPNVPPIERGFVGDVPQNLYQLIHGADSSGRLTFPLPAPGHVLLLTKSIPEGKVLTGSHLISSTALSSTLANAGPRTLRGFGVFRDPSGNVHYFRTIPFDPPPMKPQSNVPWVESISHIPPRSGDAKMFKNRHIALKLGPNAEKDVYRPKDKVVLSHVSVLPITGPKGEGELRVYPNKLLEEVLAGPYGEPVWRAPRMEAEVEGNTLQKEIEEEEDDSTRERRNWIQWSDQPNWSSQESKALIKPSRDQAKGKGKVLEIPSFREMRKSASGSPMAVSPKKWLHKMKKSLFRSKSHGARLSDGDGGESSGRDGWLGLLRMRSELARRSCDWNCLLRGFRWFELRSQLGCCGGDLVSSGWTSVHDVREVMTELEMMNCDREPISGEKKKKHVKSSYTLSHKATYTSVPLLFTILHPDQTAAISPERTILNLFTLLLVAAYLHILAPVDATPILGRSGARGGYRGDSDNFESFLNNLKKTFGTPSTTSTTYGVLQDRLPRTFSLPAPESGYATWIATLQGSTLAETTWNGVQDDYETRKAGRERGPPTMDKSLQDAMVRDLGGIVGGSGGIV
ncbi:uncharacterized protein UTRI_06465 [Ustilago trichophora]|uniref:Uncharacterized protein n=1 Tax=Ustilago trichophora TaxID=86804 RepID=A0A5C3EKE0_9BASI|nr:uncharacterized protein UTRI_06465 [Ustilago trichophora]